MQPPLRECQPPAIPCLHRIDIERIEEKREKNEGMGAIYLISPQEYIVEALVADLEKKRYQSAFLVWTDVLDRSMRDRIAGSSGARRITGELELPVDFFPRESHLVTFRDPWSFPMLYNPDCNDLVKVHMPILARKVTRCCAPTNHYYQP